MSIFLYPIILRVPTLDVVDNPVKPITSEGEIEPTAEVACTPVKGTPNSTLSEPTLDVVDTPVKPITSAGEIEPTLDVVDTPVKPITSAGKIDPTVEVVDCPVSVSERLVVGDNDPTAESACTPAGVTSFPVNKIKPPRVTVAD